MTYSIWRRQDSQNTLRSGGGQENHRSESLCRVFAISAQGRCFTALCSDTGPFYSLASGKRRFK